jgi:hypothetical protein
MTVLAIGARVRVHGEQKVNLENSHNLTLLHKQLVIMIL